jgi:hypothetical protein
MTLVSITTQIYHRGFVLEMSILLMVQWKNVKYLCEKKWNIEIQSEVCTFSLKLFEIYTIEF